MRKFAAHPRSKSQAFQESFVLNILDFKKSGYFLEIGSAEGVIANNTLILESEFEWKGLALENDLSLATKYNETRFAKCLCLDATSWPAEETLLASGAPSQIDYLQVDIDPAEQSLRALVNLPFLNFRYSVITFEHDRYLSEDSHVRDASRDFLNSHGYHLFAGGIETRGRNFEDWWIDAKLESNHAFLDFQIFDIEAEKLFDIS